MMGVASTEIVSDFTSTTTGFVFIWSATMEWIRNSPNAEGIGMESGVELEDREGMCKEGIIMM